MKTTNSSLIVVIGFLLFLNGESVAQAAMTGNPTSSKTNCSCSVSPSSVKHFTRKTKTQEFALIYLYFSFNKTVHYIHTVDSFLPKQWVWTFQTQKNSGFRFLRWPYDFWMLSMGILNTQIIQNMHLSIHTNPGCSLILGSKPAIDCIASALAKVVTKVEVNRELFTSSVWCYQKKYNVYNQSRALYYVSHFVGISWGYLSYQCCYYQKNVEKMFTCYENHIDNTEWVMVFSIVGIISSVYIPLILFGLGQSMVGKNSTVPSEHHLDRIELIEYKSGLAITDERIMRENLFLGKDAPGSLRWLMHRAFPCADKHPLVFSRLKRVLFVFLSPIFIYIYIAIYYKNFKKTLKASLDNNIPIGFLAMPFGFHVSFWNWYGFMGGPYVLLGINFIAGIAFLCIPKDFPFILSTTIKSYRRRCWTYLVLDIRDFEHFGSIHCDNVNHYLFLRKVLQANILLLLNKKFWVEQLKFVKKRYATLMLNFVNYCGEVRVICFFYVILFVPYIIVCVVELSLFLLFYGIPVLYISVAFLCGFRNSIKSVLCFEQRSLLVRSGFHIILSLTTFVALLWLISHYYIFCQSLVFIAQVIDFTHIAFVVYPKVSLNYSITVSTLITNCWLSIQNVRVGFLKLFKKTVNFSISLHQKRWPEKAIIDKGVLTLCNTCPAAVKKISIGTKTIELTPAQMDLMRAAQYPNYYKHLSESTPGIPAYLFETVMEKHRVLRFEITKSILKLFVMVTLWMLSLMLWTMFGDFENSSPTFTLLGATAVTILPNILGKFESKSLKLCKEKVMDKKLELTVEQFWNEYYS